MTVKHNLSNTMADEVIEQPEATTPDEELELEENLDDTDDVEALKEELTKAREAQRQTLARAKKAEDKLKVTAPHLKPKVEPTPSQLVSTTTVEETVLLANGMDEELMIKLKKVAEVQGISLLKAQNDPIFVAVKESFEKEKKAAAASMPASRGSGIMKPKKDFTSPGLTREEHMAMVSQSL